MREVLDAVIDAFGLSAHELTAAQAARREERGGFAQRLKPPEYAQQVLEPFSAVCTHFRPRRHLFPAEHSRQIRTRRFEPWRVAARLWSEA